MTVEIDFQARIEALRAKAEAAGVKIVSEEQLRARWHQRQERRGAAVKAAKVCKSERSNRKASAGRPVATVARQPYKDSDFVEQPAVPGPVDAAVTAREFTQRDFVASGAADSQNAKLLEFFSQPKNFNRWFKSTELEEMSGATRMNNRAVDLRPVFRERGHYIDNCMMAADGTGPKASYYRVCNIEDAVSLSEEQKQKLLATDGHR